MEGFVQMLELQAALLVYLLVGIICNKIGIITRANQQNFIDLVIYIFMPCMIFNSFKSITVEVLVSAFDVFLISMLICLLSWAAGKVLYRWLPELQQRVARYGTLISNAGFAGLPLAQQTFGDLGLIYGSVYLIPIRFFMWSAGVTMLSSERHSPAAVTKKLATNPCVIAIFLGLARGFAGVEFPAPVETAISSLSACVSVLDDRGGGHHRRRGPALRVQRARVLLLRRPAGGAAAGGVWAVPAYRRRRNGGGRVPPALGHAGGGDHHPAFGQIRRRRGVREQDRVYEHRALARHGTGAHAASLVPRFYRTAERTRRRAGSKRPR